MVQIISSSENETMGIGYSLGQTIIRSFKNKDSFIIGLIGDLGGGKTTFVKGLADGLGIKKNITSPSFVLLKEYKAKNFDLYHFDFYRLKDINDAKNLGLPEYFKKPKSIVLIEWADRIKNILSKDKLMIDFDFIDQNKRKLKFKPVGKKNKELIRLISSKP